MSDAKPIWIRDPLAILADGAERGIVVKDGRIVELVPAGGRPATADVAVFDAGEHVVLPGLINTHHHFYQTLTRALPAAMDRELFPWLQALYPVWARLTPERLELGVTVAMSELLLSGCTTTTDHHYVFPAGLEESVDIEVAVAKRLGVRVLLDARLDEPVAARRRPAARQRRAGRGHHPRRQRARGRKASPARRGCDGADRAGAMLAVLGDDVADARHRRSRRQARRPPAHPSRRDRGREQILPADVWLPSARLSRAMRLAQCADLARPRHLLQCRGDEAARQGQDDHQPLRVQQPDSGVGLLPGVRDGGGRCRHRHRRRRLGLERWIESDAGGAGRVPAAAGALRGDEGQPQGCAALGHQGLGGLRRPAGTRRDRGRQGRRSRAVQARRAALLRPRRSAGRAGAVRGASGRPGDGGGDNGP